MLKPDCLLGHWFVYEDGTHRRHHGSDTTSWPLTIEPLDVLALWKLHNTGPLRPSDVHFGNPDVLKPAVVLFVGDNRVLLRVADPRADLTIWERENADS